MSRQVGSALARLRTWVHEHPLATVVLAGAMVRIITATLSLSFHARDDYFHVLDPAMHWLREPGFDWDTSDLAGAGIRSHLLPRVVWLLLIATRAVGVASPEATLRVIYLVMGAYSLLVVPALWSLARRLADERTAVLAAGLAAMHFAMPYLGTRLLIEALAMPPLILGLSFATDRRVSRLVAAGIFVGLACWFRFQVGAAALGLALVVGVRAWKDGGARAATRDLVALGLGGALAIGLQGLFDLWTTGRFLGPVLANIDVNLHPAAGLSRSSPLAYLGMWLLLTLPPATFILLAPMLRAAVRLPLASVPFGLFVLLHSLIAHKEERFMAPVLPLFLLLLAAVPTELSRMPGRWGDISRRLWPATRGYTVALSVALLALAVTNESQLNLREGMRALRDDVGTKSVVSIGPEMQTFFLGERVLPIHRIARIDSAWLVRTLHTAQQTGSAVNRVLTFEPDGPKVALLLTAVGLECNQPERLGGWWADRWLYRINPRRNRRRAPVLLFRCEQPAVAMVADHGDGLRSAMGHKTGGGGMAGRASRYPWP